MKVCLVSYEFPPTIGGEGVYTYMLLKGLTRTQSVDLALIVSDRLVESQLQKEVDVHYAQIIGRAPLRLLSFSISARRKIEELLKKGEVDVIHYTNDYCGFALPKRGVDEPLVATIHHPYALEAQVYRAQAGWHIYDLLRYHATRRPLLLNRLQRNLCSNSQKVIAVSRFSAACIIKEHRIPSERITVVSNGVDQDTFNPQVQGEEMRDRWRILSERILLFTGRLDHSKGLRYLMEAFNRIVHRVPDIKLVIVGEGVLKNQLLQFTNRQKLQDYVKFTSGLDAESLPKAYAAADIVVCPSLMEGFGLSLLEGMAMGKPCVAAAAGGMTEIVSNGEDGVLVPPADSTALQRAIEMLLSDSNLCQRMGKAARKKVETDFTLERMVERTVAVYDHALTEDSLVRPDVAEEGELDSEVYHS